MMIPLLSDSIRGLSMDTMAYSNDDPVKRAGNSRLFFYLVLARKRIWACLSHAKALDSR